MRVVFLQDLSNVGRAGDIKEVSDGYGRNFLIPRGFALLATPQVLNTVEAKLQVKARSEAQTEAELQELANQLDGKEIGLEARTGSGERLYGSITAADIAAEIEKTVNITIDKRKIEMDEPIRQIGSYELSIKLAKDIVPKIKITVSEEAA